MDVQIRFSVARSLSERARDVEQRVMQLILQMRRDKKKKR